MRLAAIALFGLAVAALPSVPLGVGAGSPAAAADLSAQLAARRAQAGALRSAIGSESHRLGLLNGSIAVVEARLGRVEADLAATRARLAATEAALRRERSRLAALELQLANADRALAANLRSQFETDPPNAISVVLRSHGFADLLDRLEFVSAAKLHDQQLISVDRRSRSVVIAAADRLGALDQRQQALAAGVLSRRNDVDGIRLGLLDRAIRIERARSANAASLSAAEAQRSRLISRIAGIRAAERAAGNPGGSGSGSGSASGGGGSAPAAGQVLRGGGIVFPLPGGTASAPGTWSLDQGVDITAAGHTPLLAIGSGTVVLHGIGGFGPDAPVLHLDDGRFVYYGHAGPGSAVGIGTHVGAGQVISEIGPGIVGISTGPHLEIGFADGNGTPLGPSTASTMQALLLGAYH